MQTAAKLCALALGTVLAISLPVRAGEKDRIALNDFLHQLPRRVQDADSTPGDMVNLILLGSREQVEAATAAAEWKQADRTATEAAIRATISVLEKKVYTEMPMSELYLFDRPQDYGFARAQPIKVIAERHHFRLWETAWETDDGETIWIGAGTFDVGFEKDRRTGNITHRIDPDIDKERDFIGETLDAAGRVLGRAYLMPLDPVRQATTAHGGAYHSDGRVLVILLK
jgi:hypothetical protein